MSESVPVITIDGPSGSGKGTISQLVACELGYHYLDSGALYRLVGLAAKRHGLALDNVEDLALLSGHMDIAFKTVDGGLKVLLEGETVTNDIRGEEVGDWASRVAAYPEVRHALLKRQRAFASAPGLVADGRDMGTVVFPAAEVKIYLTASPQTRAVRRYNQLIDKGESVSLAALVAQVEERDARDQNRSISPLKPAPDAVVIDSSDLSIDEVYSAAMGIVRQRLPMAS